MYGIYEIRFHGRGGQGAKTAAAILAESALKKGKFIQSFPEYGAERKGAPVKAFTRISDSPITIHSSTKQPDLVIVVDETLIKSIPVTEGLVEDGILLVNTKKTVDEIKKMTGFEGKIYVVDATGIAMEEFGRNIPNTPLLGAIVKVTNLVDLESIKDDLEHKLREKIGERMFQANINAVQKAFDTTQI